MKKLLFLFFLCANILFMLQGVSISQNLSGIGGEFKNLLIDNPVETAVGYKVTITGHVTTQQEKTTCSMGIVISISNPLYMTIAKDILNNCKTAIQTSVTATQAAVDTAISSVGGGLGTALTLLSSGSTETSINGSVEKESSRIFMIMNGDASLCTQQVALKGIVNASIAATIAQKLNPSTSTTPSVQIPATP